MTDTAPAVEVLAEDVADLTAMVHDFASQLELNTKRLSQLTATVTAEQDGEKEKEKGKKRTGPPFILWLTGDAYAVELAALAVWVRNLLVPTYLGEVSSSATWCATWWEHPAAVARLHAAWLAWQELTNPETCELTGPSVWHRDHLDPTIAQLRAADGPFAGCMTNPDRPQHTRLPVPPVTLPPVSSVGAEPQPESTG
ncbi:DUF4913 domain-containing protein [Streptomyces sp. IB2014 011-1]|uniref:DUF4913 domain-containing protein n=1 Tax=Streptomyces sp. IB2014 011-1 TaxID=1844478 RepID=UPI000978DD15|nr:DUF4913 domain-containing protein [Streptomyces sp. IB2014 011-1]ONI48506.1 hypothetical protein STIB_73310 [Streptomyces sp. IB2014 011-1]